jgi:hypothetical protein
MGGRAVDFATSKSRWLFELRLGRIGLCLVTNSVKVSVFSIEDLVAYLEPP